MHGDMYQQNFIKKKKKQGMGWIWPADYSLSTPGLEGRHNYKSEGVQNSQWALRENTSHLAPAISDLCHWLALPTRWQKDKEV